MKIAFQMDPIGPIDINADSSFRIAEEAQARGHELFYYSPDQLAYQEGRITARGHDMVVQRVAGTPATLGELREVEHESWSTHYGPVLDFPGFGWTEDATITYRDANIDNDDFVEQYFAMVQANDLADLQKIHEDINGVPLFNTIAVSADGEAWYADTSATPNLSDEALAAYESALETDAVTQVAADNGANQAANDLVVSVCGFARCV